MIFNKKLAFISSIAILSFATMAGTPMLPMNAKVGLFGPDGEVIVFSKKDTLYSIRVCKKYTLKNEIESEQGCQLAEGTYEANFSEIELEEHLKNKLSNLNQETLAPEQRTLFVKAVLTDLRDYEAKNKELQQLQNELNKLVAFNNSPEGKGDVSKETEQNLQAQIKCLKEELVSDSEIDRAKKIVTNIVERLRNQMKDKNLTATLKYSSNGGSIAYNLLRSVATPIQCDAKKMRQALSGTICITNNGSAWRVDSETYLGKRVYLNLKKGIKVTEVLPGGKCIAPYRLPPVFGDNGLLELIHNQGLGDFDLPSTLISNSTELAVSNTRSSKETKFIPATPVYNSRLVYFYPTGTMRRYPSLNPGQFYKEEKNDMICIADKTAASVTVEMEREHQRQQQIENEQARLAQIIACKDKSVDLGQVKIGFQCVNNGIIFELAERKGSARVWKKVELK